MVKQSNKKQGVVIDKSNLIENISGKPVRLDTVALYDNYKERGVSNDFSGVSQDETKTKSDLGLDI